LWICVADELAFFSDNAKVRKTDSVKLSHLVILQFRLTNSQRYLLNAKPDTNHSTKPTNPKANGNSKR